MIQFADRSVKAQILGGRELQTQLEGLDVLVIEGNNSAIGSGRAGGYLIGDEPGLVAFGK